MWPRFDLTHGELARLCRKAGKPEYVNHIRSHYDNVRKQLFQKLDWFTERFLASDTAKDPNTGWLKPVGANADGTPGFSAIPRYPKAPNDSQLQAAHLMEVKSLKQAWANMSDKSWHFEYTNKADG